MLGENEKLKEPDTGVDLATIDLLAFEPNSRTFLLVACTMGVPREDDFTRLLNLEHFFDEKVFSEARVVVRSVVFTASKFQSCWQQPGSEGATMRAVIPVIDVARSQSLFSLISNHREGGLLSFIQNPEFYAFA